MSKRVGFIGAGMMAEAIIRGLLNADADVEIAASDVDKSRLDKLKNEYGIEISESNRSAAESSDIIILAVKPHIIAHILDEISGILKPGKLVISIAAGVKTETIESKIGEVPVVRVMPNTPALIGAGATAIAPGRYASSEDLTAAEEIFSSVGIAVRVPEEQMDAVTGMIGSGPAYVYTFIEALADGGVRMGMAKSTALTIAAQTVAGASKMVLETGEHPAELRDKVMTPGGATIAGIASLEKDGFRSAVIEAVTAATKRSKELGKQ